MNKDGDSNMPKNINLSFDIAGDVHLLIRGLLADSALGIEKSR